MLMLHLISMAKCRMEKILAPECYIELQAEFAITFLNKFEISVQTDRGKW
jgi:hypothetical protein